MKKISIYKNNIVTNSAEFATQEELEQWFDYHKGLGTFGEDYEAHMEDISDKLEQERINKECLQYLAETDFLVIRAMENPTKAIPEEILIKRQLCRDSIIKQ